MVNKYKSWGGGRKRNGVIMKMEMIIIIMLLLLLLGRLDQGKEEEVFAAGKIAEVWKLL